MVPVGRPLPGTTGPTVIRKKSRPLPRVTVLTVIRVALLLTSKGSGSDELELVVSLPW